MNKNIKFGHTQTHIWGTVEGKCKENVAHQQTQSYLIQAWWGPVGRYCTPNLIIIVCNSIGNSVDMVNE